MITPAVKWRNRLISLVVFAGLWEVAGRTIESLLLPTFSETVTAFARLITTHELWSAFYLSNQALVIGYAAALLIGLPLGVWIGSSRTLERIAGGYLTIILLTPTAALIPLIIIAVGLNLTARVMVVCLFAVPFIILNTRAGLSEIDRSLIEMAQSFCATRWQILWRTVIPAALPGMMLGARVGLGRAIAGMVMVELLLIAVGMGRLILTYQARFDAGSVYAVILVILLEAVLLTKIARWLEGRIMPLVSTGMIEIAHVSKAFIQRSDRGTTDALRDVSLTVRDHEFVCIIGPSGCGKTTLLKVIGGLVQPDSGDVRINGAPVRGPGADRGMVFQHFALLPWANVLDNVAFGLSLKGIGKDARHHAAQTLIEAVGLAGFEKHYPRELSGGMQQRVGLARALAIDPDILLMDEPFGAVDAQTRRSLQEDLRRLVESSRKTVVFVTHSMSEAVRLGDRVALMGPRPGRIVDCIDIPLPRPRPDDMDRLPAFVEMKEYLWQRLKSMQDGEASYG